jgi:hypothetical protein
MHSFLLLIFCFMRAINYDFHPDTYTHIYIKFSLLIHTLLCNAKLCYYSAGGVLATPLAPCPILAFFLSLNSRIFLFISGIRSTSEPTAPSFFSLKTGHRIWVLSNHSSCEKCRSLRSYLRDFSPLVYLSLLFF